MLRTEATVRNMYQKLLFVLGYNTFGVPIAARCFVHDLCNPAVALIAALAMCLELGLGGR